MSEDLHLAGLSQRTHDGYLRSIRQLADYCECSPEQINEDQLRRFFLYLKNERNFAAGSLTVALSGLEVLLRYDLPTRLADAWCDSRFNAPSRCPKFSRESKSIRSSPTARPNASPFIFGPSTRWDCGWKKRSTLQVGDIDADRGLVHIHRGKGAKDRYVPLPTSTLVQLRSYWSTHRHPRFLFPAEGRSHNEVAAAKSPMAPTTVQGAIKKITRQINFGKKVSIHTLRHCYATHLLEAGVSLRVIQKYLGHTSLQTTTVYLHLTETAEVDARKTIEAIFRWPESCRTGSNLRGRRQRVVPTVADCIRQHAACYLFGKHVPLHQRKVIESISRCRTGQLGGTVFACSSCARTHWVGRSCGNRHCPTCQVERTAKWLGKQTNRMLPVHHFLVTFTVPEAVRRLLRATSTAKLRAGYAAIFACGSAPPLAGC